jgi:hypothetical protein
MKSIAKFVKENESEMLHGGRNRAIRYYFYAKKGLEVINEFRYIFMAVFGVYYLTKMSNPFLLVLMFVIAIPLMAFIGWLSVHYMAVVLEFLSIRYTTAWAKYGYELQERTMSAVESINDKINKD